MTIGDRIKARRAYLDMTLEDVAKVVGVTRATIQKYENGIIGNIPYEKIVSLASALKMTPAALMGWEDSDSPLPSNILPMPGFYKAPRLGRIACGEPILAEENIEAYDDVPDYIKCDFTLVCRGDSMINARIFDGDIVCIKADAQIHNGDIAAVLVDGDEATLKRVRLFPDHISLEPENPMYKPFVFWNEDMNKVRFIGKATHFMSVVR